MNIELFTVIGLAVVLISGCVSAFFWEKLPILRKAPFFAPLFVGTVYQFSSLGPWNSFIEASAGSLLIGVIYYFSIWIQCRKKNEPFF